MGLVIIILVLIGISFYILKNKSKINININKSVIIGIIIALVVIGIIIIVSRVVVITSVSNIEERQYQKIANNLYYTNELIEYKGQDETETILNYYKTISDYLSQKYPSLSFYITNFNYNTLNKENDGITFNLYQMMDMAIVEGSIFSLEMENGKIREYDDSDFGFSDSDNFIFQNLNATINVGIDDAKKTALNLAKKNADEIFTFNDYLKIIDGECYLNYNNEDGFFYTIVLNNGSYVKIDTTTGNVIESYFFNGIIE